VELVLIQTVGDQVRDRPLAQIGGDGLFTREIQQALLDDRVDLAVHSLKDLPTLPLRGLTLAAVPPRGPTGDALVSRRHPSFEALPKGAVVATSSLRRRAQVLHRRPDLTLVDIRGNVDTRLRKLDDAGLDALILAEAGLVRLDFEAEIREVLDPGWMLPAVGQGALGIECREDDRETRRLLAKLEDQATRQAVCAERALLRALGGGCQVPIGVRTSALPDGGLLLACAIVSPDGRRRVALERTGRADDAEALGATLADDLREAGGAAILAELNRGR
jgi:hydroxymethylbilane synthase